MRAVDGSVQRRPDYAVMRSQVLRFYANAAWLTFDGQVRRPGGARQAVSDDT
jgi:hypothetical protein